MAFILSIMKIPPLFNYDMTTQTSVNDNRTQSTKMLSFLSYGKLLSDTFNIETLQRTVDMVVFLR
jgi:hypothetical protein